MSSPCPHIVPSTQVSCSTPDNLRSSRGPCDARCVADEGKLNRWRLFAELTSEDADVVLDACEERNLVGGEELFRENDPGDSLFIVQSGRVDIFKNIRGDVDRSLASFGPGDVIGEMSFIDGARRSATARTTEASEFLVLSRQSFAKVQRERPDIAAAFFRNMAGIVASRLRTTNELYREAVAYGIEATGAHTLNLKALADELRPVMLHLAGGQSVAGRILQMDHHAAGYTVVLKLDSERLTIVPYHAIQRIDLA
ncbi:MAG: cyclic nucleotide-binding domain-containing protein [Deltaproteobacteria bacterium]|nr:MAG: cyclic nucleotide-binding domain-containing protein [Deltaproteobacteria bacterium]